MDDVSTSAYKSIESYLRLIPEETPVVMGIRGPGGGSTEFIPVRGPLYRGVNVDYYYSAEAYERLRFLYAYSLREEEYLCREIDDLYEQIRLLKQESLK